MSEASRKRVCMWLDARLHARLKKVAERERRSMADTGIIAIERYLDEAEGGEAAKKK